MDKNTALEMISKEHDKAVSKFGKFHTQHEGYAVILEEVDELWDEIKKNQKNYDIEAQRKEAMQISAMALRFMVDCT
jgi:NTP pyrophosphatase (non-canonical NTP hydrolase)